MRARGSSQSCDNDCRTERTITRLYATTSLLYTNPIVYGTVKVKTPIVHVTPECTVAIELEVPFFAFLVGRIRDHEVALFAKTVIRSVSRCVAYGVGVLWANVKSRVSCTPRTNRAIEAIKVIPKFTRICRVKKPTGTSKTVADRTAGERRAWPRMAGCVGPI